MGDFADFKSVHTIRHSAGVADLVTAAASAARVPTGELAALRLAALGHDLGRVAVTNAIWDKPGALAEAEWEKVRLHPYYSERLLGRPPALSSVATVAGAHHERLDGSGYHRGSRGSALSLGARLLAVADAYQAMTQSRAHRPALAAEQAVCEINSQVATGRLDPDAARMVLGAAGHEAPRVRRSWPEGLTEREVEVLRRVARGMSIAEAASDLHVAPKTVDFHLQNVYSKAGVSTRAAATLFAIEHGILETAG